MLDRPFGHRPRAVQRPDGVDGEEARRLGRLDVDQRRSGKSGGVVDEDVDRAEAIDGRRHHPLAVPGSATSAAT